MTDKIIEREIRKRKAQERLGKKNLRCFCGETSPLCFEAHHIAQRRYSGELYDVCKNCHAKASDLQNDHPKPLGGEPTQQERFAHMLLGLADLLLLAVDKLWEIAQWLINEAKRSIENKNSQET